MTTIAQGNRRLLQLAKILERADADHLAAGTAGYDRRIYQNDDGSPASALGHWVLNPDQEDRWFGQDNGWPVLEGFFDPAASARHEFSLDEYEHLSLFGWEECGKANTAKQAADFIRAFVKKRVVKPVRKNTKPVSKKKAAKK
jgi:hypothetical protein